MEGPPSFHLDLPTLPSLPPFPPPSPPPFPSPSLPPSPSQVMGQEKKHLQGMAAAQGIPHAGVLIGCDVVLGAPPALRQKALRLVASKFALTTRMDAYQQEGGGEGGEGGRAFRAECEDKIMKWQEPSKGKEKKALPVPEMQARKKRAGKRVSKARERFAMTEMRKEHGRRCVPFFIPSLLPSLCIDQKRQGVLSLNPPSLPPSLPSSLPPSLRAFGDASTGAEYGDEAMGMDTGTCFQMPFLPSLPPSLPPFLPSFLPSYPYISSNFMGGFSSLLPSLCQVCWGRQEGDSDCQVPRSRSRILGKRRRKR